MNYKKFFPNDFVEFEILVILGRLDSRLTKTFKAKSEVEKIGLLILDLLRLLNVVAPRTSFRRTQQLDPDG